MKLSDVVKFTENDMTQVNQLILDRLSSDVVLINQIGHYIINSGGKRLRPLLLLLSARACNYNGQHHYLMAAVIEFIHTATLLHDDVVDESDTRRGKETANEVWGNAASVLVGDFLYSRAFQMMVEPQNLRIMDILSETTNTIAEGEVLQLLNCNDPDTTEERYIEVIHRKTAKLFEAATQIGALLAEQNDETERSMADFGMHLGAAFQLVDDALDYTSSAEEMGKNVGDDLAEGKPTLPLIYAMKTGTPEEAALIRSAIEQGGLDHLDNIIECVKNCGAIEYTINRAKKEAELAKQCITNIPDSEAKNCLLFLADYSVLRTH